MTEPAPPRTRTRYALATTGALTVTALFATVGDGVEVAGAVGLHRFVVDHGHLAVWALLTGAFGIAAARGRWTRASAVCAVGSAITYMSFLTAVFWPTP